MFFSLADEGSAFATRPKGQLLREQLIAKLGASQHVTISLDQVSQLSYSFADEFIGATVATLGPERVTLKDVPESQEDIILASLRQRGVDLDLLELFKMASA